MEIPVHTTIAFALTELEIRHDGHFGESYKISVLFQQELFVHATCFTVCRAVPDVRHQGRF